MSMETAAAVLTLDAQSDDVFQQIIGACSDDEGGDVPLFDAVKGLSCSKTLLQQLQRLRPLVGVYSLAAVQRPAHGPWRVVLLNTGKLTKAVMGQARQGRVRSINSQYTTLARAVARRVVPGLLGAGCLLCELHVDGAELDSTWVATFGEAAVCSTALRALCLFHCSLRGPLPELRLPALRTLHLSSNLLIGGLEPLQACTALRELYIFRNRLTGGLAPLRAALRCGCST